MSKNVPTLFDASDEIPDYLRDEESNIAPKQTVPTLSFEGKVWTISVGGEKTKLMKRDADGDEAPLAVFRGVILGYAKNRGRTLYEGNYDPDNPGMPLCWSDDGVHPADNVADPQSDRCATCQFAQKGSKDTDNGKKVAKCSQHLLVAVVPATQLDFPPLRMKLPITSIYDKESPELANMGWRAFDQYIDTFRQHNVPSTVVVVTKMRFDPNVTYPKVLFSSDRYLKKEEHAIVSPIAKSEAVANLLANRFQSSGEETRALPGAEKQKALPAPKKKAKMEDEEDEDDKLIQPKVKAKKPPVDEDEEELPKAKAKKPPVDEDEEDELPAAKPKKAKAVIIDEDEEEMPAPKKAKKAPPPDEDEEEELPVKKPAKATKKAVDEDEEDEPPAAPAKKKAAPAASAAAKGGSAAKLDSLLGEWGDEEDEAPAKKKKRTRDEEDED